MASQKKRQGAVYADTFTQSAIPYVSSYTREEWEEEQRKKQELAYKTALSSALNASQGRYAVSYTGQIPQAGRTTPQVLYKNPTTPTMTAQQYYESLDLDKIRKQQEELRNQYKMQGWLGDAARWAGNKLYGAAGSSVGGQVGDLLSKKGNGYKEGVLAEMFGRDETTAKIAQLQQLYNKAQEAQQYKQDEKTIADFEDKLTKTGTWSVLDRYKNPEKLDTDFQRVDDTPLPSADWGGTYPTNDQGYEYLGEYDRGRQKAMEGFAGTGITEEDVQNYLKAKRRVQNKADYEEKLAADMQRMADYDEGGYGTFGKIDVTIKNLPRRLLGGGAGALSAALTDMNGDPVDWYDPFNQPGQLNKATTEAITQSIDSKIGQQAYQLGNSAMDSLTVALLSRAGIPTWVGATMMGGSAAQQTMLEAKERGLDDAHAVGTGIAAGIAEEFFEKYSLDSFVNLPKVDAATKLGRFGRFASNVAKQAGVEGSEEVFTDLANQAFDRMYNGGLSEYEQNVQRYMADGKSRGEAEKLATTDFCKQLGMSFAGGALLGGIMGGAGTGINTLAANAQYGQRYGGENLQQSIDTAMEVDPNNAAARVAQDQLARGKKVGGGQIRAMMQTAARTEAEAKIKTAARQRLEELQGGTGKTVYSDNETLQMAADMAAQGKYALAIGLVQNDAEALRALGVTMEDSAVNPDADVENADSIKNALKEMVKQGRTVQTPAADKQLDEVADAVTRAMTGEMDEDDAELLKKSKIGRQVLEELTDTTGRSDNAWTEGIDTRLTTTGKQTERAIREYQRMRDAVKGTVLTTEDEAELKRNYGELGVKAFREFKPEGIDDSTYYHAFNVAYTYGYTGVAEQKALDLVKDLPAAAVKAAWAAGMDMATRQAAKVSGKIAANTTTVKRGEGKFTVAKDIDMSALTSQQRFAVYVAKALSRLTSLNVEVFQSKADANGNITEDEQGSYNDTTHTLRVDINAGVSNVNDIAERTMAKVMSHELTHFIQQNNAEGYLALKNFVTEQLAEKGMDIEKLVQSKIDADPSLTTGAALDEVIADACEDMLGNSEAIDQLAQENWGLFKRIRNWIRNFHRTLRNALGGYSHPEAKAMLDRAEELQKLWDDAFVKAVQNYQMTADEIVESGRANEMTNEAGETTLAADATGHSQNSVRTWDEGGRDNLKKYLDGRVKEKAITREEANEMMAQMDFMYRICKDYADKDAVFGEWSRAEVKVDPKTGNAVFSVVKANGDYAMNLDFSLVCKKRRTLDAVFDAMIKQGIMDDFDMVESSIAAINDIIREYGFETACALCFVDSKRYRQGIVADAFVGMYNNLVRSMVKDGQHLDAFNYGGNSLIQNDGMGIDTLPDSALDFTEIDRVLKTEGQKTVAYKIARHLKNNPQDRKLLMRGDFMSANSFDTIKQQNPALMQLYNAKKGAGGPKAASLDVQYLNEILAPRKFNKAKAYSVGGVRIQSFSDYIPRLVFDYVQMIADLSAKQLPAHAYTKEPLFILQFGLSGVKSNMSLVPEVVEGGVAPGLDKDGNYAWRDGQSFGSTVYGGSKALIRKYFEIIGKKYSGQDRLTAAEGFELAKAIQNADGYHANCGTIAVGVSYEHILKLLRDPDIRMVIPYHKSSLNHIVAVMTNIDKYTDYTGVQNTRMWAVDEETGKEGWVRLKGKDFNFNEALLRLGDAKAAAQEYLDWCKKKGYQPKFDMFAGEENYYKLLEDFTCYDRDGNAAPQTGVTLTLPTAESAFGSMQEFIGMGVEEDALLQAKQDKAVPEIVKQIQAVLPAREAEMRGERVQYSLRQAKEIGFDTLIEQYYKRNINRSNPIYIGSFEKTSQSLFNSSAPFLITGSDLTKSTRENKGNSRSLHGVPESFIRHLPSIIDGACFGYREDRSGVDSFTFIVYDDESEKLYSIGGALNVQYEGETVNRVLSIFDIGNPAAFLSNKNKHLVTTDEKTAKEILEKAGIQSPALQDILDRTEIVPQVKQNVNTQSSTRQRDAEYAELAIDPSGNEQQLQRMVDEAAMEAGYDIKAYHGTTAFGFTVFGNPQKAGFFFTDRLETASTYSGRESVTQVSKKVRKDKAGNKRGNYAVYIKGKNMLTVDCKFRNWDDIAIPGNEVDRTDGRFYGLDVTNETRYGWNDYTTTDNIVAFAKKKGYDGVVFENLRDNSNQNPRYRSVVEGGKGEKLGTSTVYAVFDSEQIKSADPVTYDDNGNVIPLSERFNTEKEDIRYSTRQRDVDSFTTKEDIDAEIARVQDLIRDIQNAQWNANEAAKSDPRVQAAQERMWAAEDAKGRAGSLKERVEYKRILKEVKDELAAEIPEGDINELAQRVNELKELREQFLKVTPISAAQYEKLVKHFGTTDDYDVAGFILQDGRMLDFSGKKQYGKDYAGGREVYHNEVGDVLNLPTDTSPRIDMVSNGNIRIVPEINGINLSQKPTAAQRDALRGFIDHHDGSVHVDIDNAAGRNLKTFGYHKGTSASKILADIDNYFNTGEAPAPQSNLRMFYSRRTGGDSIQALQEETDELEKRVKDLEKTLAKRERELAKTKQDVRNWRDRATFSPERVGKDIIKAYGGTVTEQEIHDDVRKLLEYAGRRSGISFNEIQRLAAPIAAKVVKSAQAVVNGEEVQTWEDMKDYLRKGRIKIGQNVINDFTEWGDFWRRNGRRLNLVTSKEGTPVDVAYAAMGEQFGYTYFPESITHPADQLRRIAEVYDNLQPAFENPYSWNMAMAAEEAANDLIDMVMAEVARGYKATYTGRLQEQVYQSRQYTERLLKKERQRSDERVAELKRGWREQRIKDMEDREDSELRTRLLNVAKRLKNKKLPTVSRALLNKMVNEILSDVQREIFDKLDTESRGMRASTREGLEWLRDSYEDLKQNDPNFIPDPKTEERIKRLSKIQIDSLSHQDVVELTYALLNIENEIRNEKRLIDSAERRELFEAGAQAMDDIKNAPGSKASGVTSLLDKYIVTETLSPVRQMRRLVGYVDSDPLLIATNELADGQRKMFDYTMRAKRRFQEFVDDKAFMESIAGKKAKTTTIQGIGENGPVSVEVTRAMMIALYLHSKNNQSLTHIAGGGIRVPNMAEYRKGNIAEAYARGTVLKLEPQQVRAIQLTAREKQFADAVYDYFNTISKREVNAVSEKLLGYPVAEVENYFPINTDDSYIPRDFESIKFDGSIEGMGFLKERIKSAKPINLLDVTDVLTRSIDQHAKYVGLGIPVRNINKLWGVTAHNYTEEGAGADSSLQSVIRQQWGETGRKYIEKMMKDLQNGGKEQNVWGKALSKVRSAYAGAVLTLNASVAMKQAASYPTAAAVVGWSPLIKAFGNVGKVDMDLISTYTPLQWYRSQGFSTQEIGDMTKRGIHLPTWLNWVQGMDVLTTRKLWKAAEIYVAGNYKLERGTKEQIRNGQSAFYKKVAEVYNRIIEETQPNYTTMQRPQLLRTDDTLMQNLQMFKTQPFQNFNILYDSIGELQARERAWKINPTEENANAVKDAKKKAAWAVTSQAAQLAVFALMTLLWNAFRGKKDKYKDDEGDMTFFSTAKGVGLDMIGGLFSEIPFGGNLWDYASAKITGGKYYGVEDVTTSALNDAITSLSNAGKTISGLLTGEITDFNTARLKMDSVFDSVSKVLGIPYENVLNLGKAIYQKSAKALEGDYVGRYHYLQLTTDPNNDTQKAGYYDLLYEAYRKDPAAHKELYDMMIADGWSADSIKSAMEKRMKKDEGVNNVKDLSHRYEAP